MRAQLKTAFFAFAIFTVLTGIVYPLLITGISQLIFPHQANGSLLLKDSTVVGSELIGQPFDAPQYFWSRPSATTPYPYHAAASAGSNFGPANPALIETVQARIAHLKSADPQNSLPIPIDLVTASASGLDPHISVASALYQVPRVARMRGLSEEVVLELVSRCTKQAQFGFLGEARVNVLALNLALDEIQ